MQYLPTRLGGTPQWLKDTMGVIQQVAPIAGGFVGAATGTAALTNFSAALAGQEVSSGYANLYATEQNADLKKLQLQQSLLGRNRTSPGYGDGSSGSPPGGPGTTSGPDMGLIVLLGGGALLLVALAAR